MGRIHHTPPGGSEEICFCPIFSLILLVFGLAGLPLFSLDWLGPERLFSLGLRQVPRFFLFDGSRPAGPSPRGSSGPAAPVQLVAPGVSCLEALGSQGAPTQACSFSPCSMELACSLRSRLSPTLQPLLAGADAAAALGRGALPAGAPARYPWAAGSPLTEGLIRWPTGSHCSSHQTARCIPCLLPFVIVSPLARLVLPCWAARHPLP